MAVLKNVFHPVFRVDSMQKRLEHSNSLISLRLLFTITALATHQICNSRATDRRVIHGNATTYPQVHSLDSKIGRNSVLIYRKCKNTTLFSYTWSRLKLFELILSKHRKGQAEDTELSLKGGQQMLAEDVEQESKQKAKIRAANERSFLR